MKARRVLLPLLFLLIVASGLFLYAWLTRPQLEGITPATGAKNISPVTSIRLTFSRNMDPGSLSSRLNIEPAVNFSLQWAANTLVITPNAAWPSRQEITVSLAAGARAHNRLAFPLQAASWSFTTRQVGLAYLWPSSGPADIYELDPLSGEAQQLTRGMAVLEYTVSSDGMMIYYSANNSQGGTVLYQFDRKIPSASPRSSYQGDKLLDCGVAQCRNPVASLDGTRLAYEYLLPDPAGGLAPSQVWMMDLGTYDVSLVGQANHETVQPGWSIGGLLAYYDRTDQAYEVFDPATLQRMEFTNQTGQPGNWSPDGTNYLAPEISFGTAPSGNEIVVSHLVSYSIPSGTATDLSGLLDVEDVNPNYSPSGGLIAFSRGLLQANQWTLGRQIWAMNADGSGQHAITSEADYNHYDFSWSRDGQMIAYVRFNQASFSDQPELWMVNKDGSNPIQLVIGGFSPEWIP